MPRLNNKDFTVEELERLIYLVNVIIAERFYKDSEPESTYDELSNLVKHTTLSETSKEPNAIIWNFTFKMSFHPDSMSQSEVIKNAMRSKEVNEEIKRRFGSLVYEEINWYQDRVKTFMVKGDSNILE